MDAANSTLHPARQGAAPVLALGFGTAAAMWAAGYLAHLPGLPALPWLSLLLLLAVLLGGGYLAGKLTDSALTGLYAGLTAGLLNLLILGSLAGPALRGGGGSQAMLALAVSVVASGALAALAALAGRLRYDPDRPQPDWTNAFVRVAAGTTLLLIFAGGLVTSTNSGLAVPDWPASFGQVMWLLPLADMTGGVYFEHAHRLLGSLVGFTTLVLLVHLWRVPAASRGAKWLATGIFLLVGVQGVLGGLRVTDKSVPLAVLHGISAQVIFGLIVLLVVLTAPAFRRFRPAESLPEIGGDLNFSRWLLGLLVVQLILGTLFRQGITARGDIMSHAGLGHMMLALFVAGVAVLAGLRARRHSDAAPGLARSGKSVLHTVGLQFILGIAAFATVAALGALHPATVIVATLHQTNGALLLGAVVMLLAWNVKAEVLSRPAQAQ
jgi:cytochrome c oxidase assembly protein subunit 15